MLKRTDFVVTPVSVSWPGWSKDRRLVLFVTSGILWLAAIHPGHAASPAARRGSLPGLHRFSLDDVVGLQRPIVEIGPIAPQRLKLSPAPPVISAAGTDSPYVYWPPRPAKRPPGSPAPVALPLLLVASVPSDEEKFVTGRLSGEVDDTGDEEEDGEDNVAGEDDVVEEDAVKQNLPPLVHLVAPNGGEVLISDTTLVIGWQATDEEDVARVRLEFSADGGRHWKLLADSLDNSGEWEWKVPWIETRRGRLRVTAHDDSSLAGVDVSDRNFTIARPLWMTRGRPLLVLYLNGPIPNPVRDACRFLVGMPESGLAELVLFAVSGRVVRRLWSGPLDVGSNPIDWDGRDDGGQPATSGIYFARLIALGSRIARRLVLVR